VAGRRVTDAHTLPGDASPKRPREAGFTWRWTRRLYTVLMALLFGLPGALGIGLAFGPVSLGPLVPVLIGAVGDSIAGYKLAASDALLEWSVEETRLVVRFIDPRLVDEDGVEIASANDIAVAFSVDALIGGRIAPRSLAIIGPTATFMRLKNGGYDIGIRAESRRNRQVSATETDAGPFIDALLEPPKRGEYNSYLSEIRLDNATITFIDEATESIVKAPRGTLVVTRTPSGLDATLDGQVSLPDGNWHFAAEATFDRGAPVVQVKARLENANLDALADAGPLFEPFEGAEVPLNGQLALSLDTRGKLLSAQVDVASTAPGHFEVQALSNIGLEVKSAEVHAAYDASQDLFTLTGVRIDSDAVAGTVTGSYHLKRGADGRMSGWHAEMEVLNGFVAIPDIFDGVTPVERLAAVADNDLVKDVLTIQSVDLRSGESAIGMRGVVSGLLAEAPYLNITGEMSDIPLARLGSLWPKGVATGARDWVSENVEGGKITEGTFRLNVAADTLDGAVPDEAVRFAFAYEGVRIKYIDELPPLQDVSGTAIVSGNAFDAAVDAAHVGAVKLTLGHVRIGDLNIKGQPAEISGIVTGSARDVLTLIDMEPLGYPSRFGLDPKTIDGDAQVNLGLVVPTFSALKVEDIGFDIKAKLSHAAMNIAPGLRLTKGEAEFAVTGSGLTASGSANVAGVDATFAWEENFNPGPDRISTTFHLRAGIDEALRQHFGVDPGSYLDGIARIDMTMRGRGFDPASVTADVDLTDAALNVPELGYRKPIGRPARLTADVARVSEGYYARSIVLKGEGIDADLELLLGPDGRLRRIEAKRLVAGRNNGAFLVDDTGPKTIVTGKVEALDLETLIDALLSPTEEPAKPADPVAVAVPDENVLNIEMHITAKRVLLREGDEARDLVFDVDLDRGWLKQLMLRAKMTSGQFLAGLTEEPDGRRRVTVESDDMGRLIRGISGFDSVQEGVGVLNLSMAPVGTLADPEGRFTLKDFRITNQPFLIRLFSAGSFTGLIDLLTGEGITVRKLVADIGMHGDRFTVRNFRLKGPSIGAEAEGFVDRGNDTVGFVGTLAPFYYPNTLPGQIPGLGEVFGGDGGILALAFEVKGAMEEPDLAVDPLSFLAPGFLRKLFEYDSPLEAPRS